MIFAVLLIAVCSPLLAYATDSSTEPCHAGHCSWDHADNHGYGRFNLTGPVSSISDLTPSAGWTILDCNSSATAQDIRLVCHDPSKGCDHLYLNGANNTVVKLPDGCGSMAFAFVKNVWDHDDQSIPGHKRYLLAYRDSTSSGPIVKGITLSTNYTELNHTAHGEVSFDTFGFAGRAPAGNMKRSSCIGWTKWDCTGATTPQPFNYARKDQLYSNSFSCPQQGDVPGYAGGVDVGLETDLDGSMILGWSVVGTLLHPTQEVEFYFGLNTTISGTLEISANLNGTLSSGRVTLLDIPLIPEAGIPGVVNIGPAFKVYAEADATLHAHVNMSVGIEYALTDAKLYFPDTTGLSGSFNPVESTLQLSASPDVPVQGTLAVHLIPSLALDFNLLHIFDTSIGLDLDASAALGMTLYADADASTSTNGGSSADANWGGCVNATTSLNVEASADIALPGYQKNAPLPLWGQTWPLYSRCFSGSATGPLPTPAGSRAYGDLEDDHVPAGPGSSQEGVKRYAKIATPPRSAPPSIPSGCGSNGNGNPLVSILAGF